MSDLKQWDHEIAPVLHGIKFDAIWLKRDADSIAERCQKLAARPAFETEAEAAISETISLLEEIVNQLEAARNKYRMKPVEK